MVDQRWGWRRKYKLNSRLCPYLAGQYSIATHGTDRFGTRIIKRWYRESCIFTILFSNLGLKKKKSQSMHCDAYIKRSLPIPSPNLRYIRVQNIV